MSAARDGLTERNLDKSSLCCLYQKETRPDGRVFLFAVLS
jgi:hypothetical protein